MLNRMYCSTSMVALELRKALELRSLENFRSTRKEFEFMNLYLRVYSSGSNLNPTELLNLSH